MLKGLNKKIPLVKSCPSLLPVRRIDLGKVRAKHGVLLQQLGETLGDWQALIA